MLAGRRSLPGALVVSLCGIAGLAILIAASTSLARLVHHPYHPPTWAMFVALGYVLAYGIAAARLVRAPQRRAPGDAGPSGRSRAAGAVVVVLFLAPLAFGVGTIRDDRHPHGGIHVDPALQVIGKADALGLGALLLIAATVIAWRTWGPQRRSAEGRGTAATTDRAR